MLYDTQTSGTMRTGGPWPIDGDGDDDDGIDDHVEDNDDDDYDGDCVDDSDDRDD